jgi:hypothetical protein
MLPVRAAARIPEEIQIVPDLLPEAGARRRDSGGYQSELVKETS